ncbi:MAG TPA: GyrI-like domain-containing protein [Lachnospiraceae bacterium]|nr:GyrI-like domain-containing protein [Lachnospiraceae bacterium]
MDWLECMNASLDYIEENMSIKIDFEKVAAKACCSSYNFQRMFSFIAGITLATYVRRRCMTTAAQELVNSDATVLDIAIKYGYDSPVSFARAFSLLHGLTPSEARKEGAKLKLYPKISFLLSIKGAEEMKYRIEKMGSFNLAGVSREISTANGENFKQVPHMWDDVCSDGTCDMIFGMNGNEKEEMYGVCYDFRFHEEKFRYMIAVKPEGQIPESCETLHVPELNWVKFECNGVAGIQDVFKRMYSEWFPASGYEHAEGPEIEWYSTDDMGSPDYRCEVWVPIQPKK